MRWTRPSCRGKSKRERERAVGEEEEEEEEEYPVQICSAAVNLMKGISSSGSHPIVPVAWHWIDDHLPT